MYLHARGNVCATPASVKRVHVDKANAHTDIQHHIAPLDLCLINVDTRYIACDVDDALR